MLVMLAVLLPLAIISSFTEYFIYRAELSRHIDAELRIAATFAKELLKADYHDRIENKDSVSDDAFDQIVNRYNELCVELGLEYIWSLLIYEDQVVFTSSTSPDKNVHNHTHAKFFEVHSNPELYEQTFKTMEPQFLDIIDKWGEIRAVLIPHYDMLGRKYLFGASKKLQNIEAMSSYILRNTLVTTAVFLIPGLIISLLASSWLTRPISRLAEAAKQIGQGEYSPTIDISGAHEINVVSEQLNNICISIQEYVKTTEQFLRELREFEEIINNSPVFVFNLDVLDNFSTVLISENISITGYTADDLISGKITWKQIVPETTIKRLVAEFEQTATRGEMTFSLKEAQLIWSDETTKYYNNVCNIIYNDAGKPQFLQGISIDVSEAVEARNQEKFYLEQLTASLRELQEFHEIVIASDSFTYRFSINGGYQTIHVSSNISITGYEASEFVENGKDWADLIPAEDYARMEAAAAEALEEKSAEYQIEYRMKWKNGETHWYIGYNKILWNEDDIPFIIQGLAVDISDRKKASEGLKLATKSLNEFHQIIISSPILIYRTLLDENHTVEFLSDNYSMLGYDIEQLRSGELSLNDLSPAEDLEQSGMIAKKALANGNESSSSEIRIRWADGSIHWYQCWNQYLRDESGQHTKTQGILTEITDLIEAKERDRHYQARLRALSQDLFRVEDKERRRLAISLHDDIGQMLAALNMKFSVLKETSDRKWIDDLIPQVDELLIRIMSTCKTLTWEISPTSLYETDIAAGLERMADELKNFFGLHIKLETMGARIVLDRDSAAFIFRCAKELMINIAKHAGVKDAEVGISKYGDKVHMVVSDSGVGFNTDLLIEKPSLGFGLFSIREHVEYMNGSLRIESAPGKGTKVMLILPLDISKRI